MKRMILTTMLIIALCSVSFAKKLVAEGKTFTTLGDYKIELADKAVTVKGVDCKTFSISYENSPILVTVAVCNDLAIDCKRYLVLSEKLNVQYVCNPGYFGVERLDKKFAKDGYITSDDSLNRSEYFHQKVLGPGRKSELEATRLIASYFPMLISNATDITATK